MALSYPNPTFVAPSSLSFFLLRFLRSLSLVFTLSGIGVAAQNGPKDWTATPFSPPSIPIAVRNPFLNGWVTQGNLPGAVTQTWTRTYDTGEQILEWYASVRVDGTPYKIYGNSNDPSITGATENALKFTPTQSSFLLTAGTVNVNMTFLSPIEPQNIVQLSTPFSYMYLTFASNDGNSHSVQVYADVSGEWMCALADAPASWTETDDSSSIYLQMSLRTPSQFAETENRPLDGTVYHATNKTNGVNWQIGDGDTLRTNFASGTALSNSANSTQGDVSTPIVTTLSFSVDAGTVASGQTSDPVVFALGVVRDPAIHYTDGNGKTEARSAYYWSTFSTVHDLITHVLGNFFPALDFSTALDNSIVNAGNTVSSNYASILALATRQAMGAIDYTLSKDSSGSWNTSDTKAFMKNMGVIGSGGINPVDVMYGAMPAFLYLNPTILQQLLTPLMVSQEGTGNTNQFAAIDIGSAYPNATSITSTSSQGIEQSANMIIMSLAYTQATNDKSFVLQHYELLNTWAGYLVDNTMNPDQQTTSTDDRLFMTNQTNLALKGILGIGAMAKISDAVGQSSDSSKYNSTASQYVQDWTSQVKLSDSIALSFGGTSSGVIYNLYADKLLGLNLLDSSIYDLQTSFYKSQISNWKYGIPMDVSNSSSVARAAATTDSSVRNSIVDQVYAYASANQDTWPFPVVYNQNNASQIWGASSPSIGALFAPLVLSASNSTLSTGGTGSAPGAGSGGSGSSSSSSSKVGAIAGVVVGGIIFIGLIGIAIFLMRRRRQRRNGDQPTVEPYDAATPLDENKTMDSSHQSPGGQPSQLNTPISYITSGIPARYRHLITPFGLRSSETSSPKSSSKRAEWEQSHGHNPMEDVDEARPYSPALGGSNPNVQHLLNQGGVGTGQGLEFPADVKEDPDRNVTTSGSGTGSGSQSQSESGRSRDRQRPETESALRNEVDMLRIQMQRMEARIAHSDHGAETEVLPSYEEEVRRDVS